MTTEGRRLDIGDQFRLEGEFARWMPDRCDIKAVAYIEDATGGAKEERTTAHSDVPCRLAIKTGVESARQAQIGGATRSVSEFWLTVPREVPLFANDEVEIQGVTYRVRQVSNNSYGFATRAMVQQVE